MARVVVPIWMLSYCAPEGKNLMAMSMNGSHGPFEKSKHSRDSLPLWRDIAELGAKNKSLNVGSILCTEKRNTELCSRLVNISDPDSLPVIYLFVFYDTCSPVDRPDCLWWRSDSMASLWKATQVYGASRTSSGGGERQWPT